MATKKQVHVKDSKTGKLKGSISLGGKTAPKSAAKKAPAKKVATPAKPIVTKKPVAKKSATKKVATPVKKVAVAPAAKRKAPGRPFPKKESLATSSVPQPVVSAPVAKAPSKPRLPEHGLSMQDFINAIPKLSKEQIEKIAKDSIAVGLRDHDTMRAIEIANNTLLDEDGDDMALIAYEEKWIEVSPQDPFGGRNVTDEEMANDPTYWIDHVWIVASNTHLALMARRKLDIEDFEEYELLTSSWRTHVGPIHPEDDDIFKA